MYCSPSANLTAVQLVGFWWLQLVFLYSCHLLLSPYSPHIISELKRQYSASCLCVAIPYLVFLVMLGGFPCWLREVGILTLLWREVLNSQGKSLLASYHIWAEKAVQCFLSLCGHPLPGFFSYARGFPLLVARSRNPDSALERSTQFSRLWRTL